MKKFSLFIASLFTTVTLASAPVVAADVLQPCSDPAFSAANSQLCQARNGKLFGPNSIWSRIISTLTYVVGAIAVLMIIIGAVRYSLSAGDQSQVTAAKNTILYALIALIVAIMANALVNFVLTNI